MLPKHWRPRNAAPSLGHKSNFKKYKLVAEQAGFTIFDLEDVFSGLTQRSLYAGEHDKHPGAKAHDLIAEDLYQELLEYLHLSNNRK